MARSFRFGVNVPRTASGADWSALCRRVEDLGFATLVMPDHLGDQFAPMAALGAAFEATDTLRMGVLVACNDFRHPVMHARNLRHWTSSRQVGSSGERELVGWRTSTRCPVFHSMMRRSVSIECRKRFG